MQYKQIQIDFYKDNPMLEQAVYDFFETKGFELVTGTYSYFQSKEAMDLESAKAVVVEFADKFSSLRKDIKKCTIVETSKPRSLLHLFRNNED